ncbi:MAG TPA: RNA polymerase sigma factor [Polyangiaceae bacterium]|nr:RNA polymerase sigma factor [Polyangiaceae bacterium]
MTPRPKKPPGDARRRSPLPGPAGARRPSAPSYPGAGPALGVVRSLPFEGDEAALVAAMASGRVDAGAAFYDRHVQSIHALVFRLMGPDGEIDDVVHDVFVRALESLPRLREPAALRSWLFGIAVRAVGIRFQRRTRQRWLRFMAPEEVPEVAAHPPSPETGEALREVYALLRGMDASERIALVLNRVEGLSLDDGARAMGTSLATFRRRLARGEAKFLTRARNRPALEAFLAEGGRAS